MEVLGIVGNGVLAGITAIAGAGGPKIENAPNNTVAPIVSPHITASPQTTINPTMNPTTQQNPTLNSVFAPSVNFYGGTPNGSVPNISQNPPTIKSGDNAMNATAPVTQTTAPAQTQQLPPTPEPLLTPAPDNQPPPTKSFSRMRFSLPQVVLATAVCTATMLYNFTRMRKLELFLQDGHNRWFTWKKDVPVEIFARTPRIELAPDLISAIQKRYLSTRTLQDFVSPLKVFLADLDQEKQTLQQLLRYSKIIRALRLGSFFGVNDHYIDQAEEGLVRLAYIKHIFNAWCAEFRVDMNNTRLPFPIDKIS